MSTRSAGRGERGHTRFNRLYAKHGRALLAYVVRRTVDPQDAADVVAETFLVAWRRLEDIPSGDTERLWLYGVARRVLANQQRAERRRQRLAERLARELPVALQSVPDSAESGLIQTALARLRPIDQEILRLAAWEQLTPTEIAAVLEIAPIAVRSRLHRARRRLQRALVGPPKVDDPSPSRLQEAL